MVKKLFHSIKTDAQLMNLQLIPPRFRNPNQEKDFLQDYFKNSVGQTRAALIFGIFALAIFSIIDVLYFPWEEARWLLFLRHVVGWGGFIGVIAFSYSPWAEKYYQFSIGFIITYIGLSVLGLMFVGTSWVISHYYVGIIITMIFGYSFLKARFKAAAISGTILTILYLLSILFFFRFDNSVEFISVLFLAVTNFIGMMINFFMEFYVRREFYLQYRLAEERDKLKDFNKKLEEQVAERTQLLTRSNDELQNFAYVISHDLQEPLRHINSYLQLLERRYAKDLDETALEFMGYVMSGAVRMKSMINDLLDFSRLETHGKTFEQVNLNTAVEETLTRLKFVIKENIARIKHDPLPTISGDYQQLTMLFQQLIDNAIKFRSKPAPSIQITSKFIDLEKKWQISVKDNGMGIESQYFERIFRIFQRLHTKEDYPGSGIGLAHCKRIVERHGGTIWVESTPGKGSTFYFTLPAN